MFEKKEGGGGGGAAGEGGKEGERSRKDRFCITITICYRVTNQLPPSSSSYVMYVPAIFP